MMHRRAEAVRAERAAEWKVRDAREKPFDFEKFDEDTARELFTARWLIVNGLRSLAPARQAILSFALAKASSKACGSAELKEAHAEAWWCEGILLRDLAPEARREAGKDHARSIRAVAVAAGKHQQAIADLIGQVLDAWLDRLCYRCSGRGFTGGWSKPKIMCPSLKQGGCGGAGNKRGARFGTTNPEHFFGLWLLNVLDTKVQGAMGRMASKTRQQ